MATKLTDYAAVPRPSKGEGQRDQWRAFQRNLRARLGGDFTPTGYGYIQEINEKGQLRKKMFRSEDETSDALSPREVQGYGTIVERELVRHPEAHPGIHYTAGAFDVSEQYDPSKITVKDLPARFRKNRVVRKRKVSLRRNERVMVQDRRLRKSNRDVVVTD